MRTASRQAEPVPGAAASRKSRAHTWVIGGSSAAAPQRCSECVDAAAVAIVTKVAIDASDMAWNAPAFVDT